MGKRHKGSGPTWVKAGGQTHDIAIYMLLKEER